MRFTLDHKVLFSLLLPLAMAACDGGSGDGTGGTGGGNGGSGATGGNGGAGGQTTDTSAGGGGGEPMKCEGPGYEGNDPDVALGIVTGNVVDQNGDPTPQNNLQLCGIDLCDYATTSDTGQFSFPANKTMKKPALKLGDGLSFAKLAILVDPGDSDFPDVVTAKLPPFGQGDLLKPGGSATSGGMTIEVPADASVEIDTLTYEDEDTQVFRAVEIPLSMNNPPVDASLGFEILFGVSPMETLFCPPAKVTVANTPAWAAGAEVEFFIQGVEIAQEWAPYGGWQKVSDGKVSDDGASVTTADGQGIPLLASVGVRLKK